MLLVLLVAAGLRIVALGRTPAGLNQDEISNIEGTETVSQGIIASFYNVGDPLGGHEGLYPLAQAITTTFLGTGLFCYRVLSVWCGLVSIALIYALGRRLFGNFVGLVAAITLTVTFWPILLSRSIIRETLLLPLMLGLLYVFARAIHLTRKVEPDTPMTVPYMVLGVLCALTAYTHWTGLLAIPLVLLFVIYLIRTRQAISRRILGFMGFALLVTLILSIPYLAFTVRVPALSGLHVYWTNRPQTILVLISSTIKTLLSIVSAGDLSPLHNVLGNALLGPLGAICLIIGLAIAIWRWRAPNMMFMLLTLVVGLIPDMWSRQPPSFANMIVALPALMILTGLGASVVAQYFWKTTDLVHDIRLLLASTAVVVVSVGIVAWLLFGVWVNDPRVDEAYHGQLGRLAAFLDRASDNLTTTICTYNLRSGDGNARIADPVLIDLMMHHEDKQLRFSNCVNGFILAAGGGTQRVAYADPKAPNSISPIFSPWLSGAQPVANSGLKSDTVVQINVEKQLADALGKLTLGRASWDTSGNSNVTLPVRMGGYLTFEGYSLDSTRTYKPNDTVTVVTYWRADGNQIPDLRIFTHILRNPDTEPVLQNDILSVDSALLGDRDVFIQVVTIPLPPAFPSGDYYVSVGAYSEITGERLPVFDNDQMRGDRLFLDTIKVQQ